MQPATPHPVPARASRAISRAVDDEYVVLDPASGTAHALSGVAARVWAASAEGSWPGEYTTDVAAAVDELVALGLLTGGDRMPRRPVMRAGITAAGVGIASILLPEANAAATVAQPVTATFTDPNTCTVFTVPVGVTYLNFVVNGAGGSATLTGVADGGNGASIRGRLVNLTPGSKVTVVVGQGGGYGTLTGPGAGRGGYASGGNGASTGLGLTGGGGGGASAIGTALSTVTTCTVSGVRTNSTIVVVAGGGAGSGALASGGNAGLANNASLLPRNGAAGQSGTGSGGGGGGAGAASSAGGSGGLGGVGGKSYWNPSPSVTQSVAATHVDNHATAVPFVNEAGHGSVTLSFP